MNSKKRTDNLVQEPIANLTDACACRENAHTFLLRKVHQHKEEIRKLQALEADINWGSISNETDQILFDAICARRY